MFERFLNMLPVCLSSQLVTRNQDLWMHNASNFKKRGVKLIILNLWSVSKLDWEIPSFYADIKILRKNFCWGRGYLFPLWYTYQPYVYKEIIPALSCPILVTADQLQVKNNYLKSFFCNTILQNIKRLKCFQFI